MMENEDNLILHAVTFDKRQAQLRSPNMERMALVNCLQYITSKEVKVSEVITDASTSVTSDLGMECYIIYISKSIVQSCSYKISQNSPFHGCLAQVQKVEEGTR